MEGMPEDMWTPYKHLYKVIGKSLSSSDTNIAELDMCLKKYKQTFNNLLKNPPKNEHARNQLRAGINEGISIPGHSRTMLISKELVDEAIIISDMFDLDEYVSIDLLCTAQKQMGLHPGLPRGLVAILLYYDGRKSIAYSLRDLFQATNGMSWITDASKEITQLISTFTTSLVDDYNILFRIIELLEKLDITKESALLTKNKAFGTKKHQNQVLELFEEIRLALATALFNWSGQRGLKKDIVAKLVQYFAKNKSTEATGNIDDVTMTLLMAFLYSCDTSLLLRQEDSTNIVQNHPVLSEHGFAQKIYEVIVADKIWSSNQELQNFLKFCFGITLASLRKIPQNLQNSLSRVIDHDEQLIDGSIAQKVFDFIYYYILEKEAIYKYEFFYRRLHVMLTDFIDFMHSKVTEMRGRADETARTVMSFAKEGLDPPSNLDHSFEMLMLCIGKLYKNNRCELSLCIDYWGPLETSSTNSKTTSRSVSLFKFIRLAGELLPPTLFVSYLKMIAGLSSCERSARNAFNLLKQVSGLSGSVTLSWEHFFGSLARYYTNLRREQYAEGDTIYKNRMLNRSINPQEIEGLRAVLNVIQAVSEYDEVARVTICEHPNWTPIPILLGLLSCSVPIDMKADILQTLSAFAKSKETAIQLWNNLEASQIISTIPSNSVYNMCHIEIEIDQNECRMETYPLSRSILDMLYTLITTAVPMNLGEGQRKPGLDPYLTFVISGVLLKFYNRNYRNSSEKWSVGEKCFKILYYLIKTYEISPQDFNETAEANPPPGFHIMLQLHTKSDLLRLILLIIDEAIILLDEYKKFDGKEELEECVLHCLNILEIALQKQNVFFEAHSLTNSFKLLSGLNKIMFDVNPRSRRPDHLLNCTKFITYCWLPRHSLASIKILNLVSRLPDKNFQMLCMLTENEQIQAEIRHGFVECLENEFHMPQNTAEENFYDTSNVKIELQIKDAVIELMQNCLTQPIPNITHFLLGFDTNRDSGFNRLKKLSVLDTSMNCTRSLVFLLDNHLEAKKVSNAYDLATEKVIEKGYRLLYSLCAHQRTSDTMLRYLRNCNDFLHRHLTAVPLKHFDQSNVISQTSYLLKCTAIELKLAAYNNQVRRFQHLCKLLIGCSGKPMHDNSIPLELNHYFLLSDDTTTGFNNNKLDEPTSQLLLCNILDCLDFDFRSQPYPKWNFFDNSLIEQILRDCEAKTDNVPNLINIKKLHYILNDELRTVQSSIASGQRQLILQEIESLLSLALKINDEKNKNHATIKLMEAWGQVTEILFSSAPDLAIADVVKQELILEVVQKILSKVTSSQAIFDLAVFSSSTVLLLLVNLRYCRSQKTLPNMDISRIDCEEAEAESVNPNFATSKSNAFNLKYILKKILEWIITSEVSSQKLRINLYACLLNCMYIVRGNSVCIEKKQEFYVSRLDKSIDNFNHNKDGSNYTQMSIEVINSFGEKLLDIICHDCIAGHDICKMSALACMDTMLDLNYMPNFTSFMSNRGYLSHIIDSLMKSDEDLCLALRSVPGNMRALYVYESKMALLLRVANSHVGAELLLGNKIIRVLSAMKVFNLHPDVQVNSTLSENKNYGFLPAPNSRYRQILFPALSLCDNIISTLGPENHSAVSQVIYFLLSHCDAIETVLRSASPFLDLGMLEEVSSITGIIARTTNQELFLLADDCSTQEFGANLYRIQRLMLSAFSRFILNEGIFKEMLNTENPFYEPTELNKDQHVKFFLEIASNLALFCRNAVSNHIADHRPTGILFFPISTEPIQGGQWNPSLKMIHNFDDILNQLKGSVEFYNAQKSITDNLLRQRSSLPSLSVDVKSRMIFFELTKLINNKYNELAHCSFITEQCLYLLWSHLDFYMHGSNEYKSNATGKLNFTDSSNASDRWLISADNMINLKKNLVSIFNEAFSKQLLAAVESNTNAERGFAEALLRRIKSLIQFASVN